MNICLLGCEVGETAPYWRREPRDLCVCLRGEFCAGTHYYNLACKAASMPWMQSYLWVNWIFSICCLKHTLIASGFLCRLLNLIFDLVICALSGSQGTDRSTWFLEIRCYSLFCPPLPYHPSPKGETTQIFLCWLSFLLSICCLLLVWEMNIILLIWNFYFFHTFTEMKI